MLSLIRNLIIVVALILGAVFGYLNYASTSVNLLWGTIDAPLVVLLALAFVAGLLIAFVVLGLKIIKLRSKLSSSRRKLRDAEAEISNLRSMPIHDA